MRRRLASLCTFAAVLFVSGQAQQAPRLADLKTTAESSGYQSTSTYDDVVRFMKAVAEASPLVHYTTYGRTYDGRDMPLTVVGAGLTDASPAGVRATNRLRVHIQGNIHGGEVEGKEAALVLLREFALGQHADWLRSMVFLITPIFNADGNEKFALTNRPRQNGPINGMGTRHQSQNLNINRDFMKLDTPESRAFVKMWNEYDPHVGFDLHTSDGSYHGYYLTYSPPLNPSTAPSIVDLMKNEWFPFVTKNIKARHGWDTFYYGNAPGGPGRGRGPVPCTPPATPTPAGAHSAVAGPAAPGAPMRTWGTFEHVPRFHNNYVGMRNRFALLSEAYAYATFEDRIKVTRYFVEEALNFAHQNAARLEKMVADADRESIIGQTLGTRAAITREGTIDILMGEVEDEINPVNGACMNRRKDVLRAETMTNGLWFAPTATEDVATEYYVPASATKAIELLRAHGVQLREVTQAVKDVEAFTIATNTQRAANLNSIDTGAHGLRTLTGAWAPDAGTTVAPGSFAVAMHQPLARLAFYLLAPTSDDGLVTWNYLDEVLTDTTVKTYPILRKK